jgi:hypothetical protein
MLLLTPLAASELAYFHAHLFARETHVDVAVPLVHTDKPYDASELATTLLAAALLDAEQRGAVTVEVGQAARLLGLRKVDALLVGRGPSPDEAPPHTLEARIRRSVKWRPRPIEARAVFGHVLKGDTAGDPHMWTIQLVEHGMLQRGLLESGEPGGLGVFQTLSHVLPDATATLARTSSPAPVQHLLARTRRDRPGVWRLLQEAITTAFAKRDAYGPD